MSKITIQSEIDAKMLLAGVANLKVSELEAFIEELRGIVIKKKAKSKKYQDAALLAKHNETILSKTKRKRHADLYEKLENDTITEKEREEFLSLSKEESSLRNERVKLLIQIATLRGVSLNDLMSELGLKPIEDA